MMLGVFVLGGPDSNSYIGDLHSLALHDRLVLQHAASERGAGTSGLVALGNLS